MTTPEAVTAIAAIDPTDPEAAHGQLDDILLEMVPAEVRIAAFELVARCGRWSS